MTNALRFDINNDGMIEYSGFPDQTYDIWIATNIHAYCDCLLIAACLAMSEITQTISINHSNIIIC